MYFAVFQFRQLGEGQPCRFVRSCAGGKRNQYFIRMQPGIMAAKIVGFQRLYRLNGGRRYQMPGVVDMG